MGIRSLFFTTVEEKKTESAGVSPVTQTPSSQPQVIGNVGTVTTQVQPIISVQPQRSGTVNEQILEQLCTLMDKTDTGKSNYLQYKKSVDALREYQVDENTRFLTAFVTLKPTNTELTREGLINSVNKYIKLIEEEHEHGQKELADVRNEVIGKQEKNH